MNWGGEDPNASLEAPPHCLKKTVDHSVLPHCHFDFQDEDQNDNAEEENTQQSFLDNGEEVQERH